MKELIKELESLIISPPKVIGYTSLRSEESITAYKIQAIINKLKDKSDN